MKLLLLGIHPDGATIVITFFSTYAFINQTAGHNYTHIIPQIPDIPPFAHSGAPTHVITDAAHTLLCEIYLTCFYKFYLKPHLASFSTIALQAADRLSSRRSPQVHTDIAMWLEKWPLVTKVLQSLHLVVSSNTRLQLLTGCFSATPY